jgi:Ala-tRNA(Pro) deacylase
LATKAEIASCCPDCECGVLPPFGTPYGLETVIDPAVEVHEHIVFEGNTRQEAIRMRYRDFYDLEHPLVVEFAVPADSRQVLESAT